MRCCPVIELRQYTLRPGQRERLISVFEHHFIESQEALGMTVLGQFRDRRRADRFVWLRGFADMESRRQALTAFYDGPVWAAHKDAANDTMLEFDDVLLLKPAHPELAFASEPSARRADASSVQPIVLAGVYRMAQSVNATAVSRFEQQVIPVLKRNGISIEGIFVTEASANTFKRLPVREGENVLVWFGTVAEPNTSAGFTERLASLIALEGQIPQILELEPTSRSLLGNGPKSARGSKHDFDFLFGSWNVHNRFLKKRLANCTEWEEFEAESRVEPLLDGFGHVDRYRAIRDGKPFEGMTLRLFDPATGEWSLHWADTVRAHKLLPPMVGRFIGGVGEFYGDETHDGQKVLCRFRWTQPAADTAQWEQAFSSDAGKTWETNWVMTFTRR